MEPAPTLLDYRQIAEEVETVILRHGLNPLVVSTYRPGTKIRVRIDTNEYSPAEPA